MFRHVRSTQKEQINNQIGSGTRLFREKSRILLRTRSRASGYCLRTSAIPMMSDFEEDFRAFPSEKETNRPNLWLKHVAKSRLINGQQEVESLRRFHHFVMANFLVQVRGVDRRLVGPYSAGSRKTRTGTEKTDWSEMQKCAKDFLTENL